MNGVDNQYQTWYDLDGSLEQRHISDEHDRETKDKPSDEEEHCLEDCCEFFDF